MTEINLDKVRLPARVQVRSGHEGYVHAKKFEVNDFPFIGELGAGITAHWKNDGCVIDFYRPRLGDITAILEEGVALPRADAHETAPAKIDLRKESLPIEAIQRGGEQVTVTKDLGNGLFEVMFDKGRREVRADGTHPERQDLDIVEIIRDAGPAYEEGDPETAPDKVPVEVPAPIITGLGLYRRRDGSGAMIREASTDGAYFVASIGNYTPDGKLIGAVPGHPWDIVSRIGGLPASETKAPADHVADAGKMILPFGLRAENGWLLHNGGECPIAAGTVVDLCFRKASPVRNPPYLRYLEMHDQQANPKDQWVHRQDEHDIIAYRVIKEAPQPAPDDATEAPPSAINEKMLEARAKYDEANAKREERIYLKRLRDQFAAAAISGSWASETPDRGQAEWAYGFADAMLAARKARKARTG